MEYSNGMNYECNNLVNLLDDIVGWCNFNFTYIQKFDFDKMM